METRRDALRGHRDDHTVQQTTWTSAQARGTELQVLTATATTKEGFIH